MRINEALRSTDVATLPAGADVATAVRLLEERNIGAIVVSAPDGGVAGIVSERDVVRRLARDGADDLLARPVAEVMTAAVHTCAPDDSVADAMLTMTEHRVRHLPVIRDGALAGIISIGDVVRARIDELAFERDQLDAYLHQG